MEVITETESPFSNSTYTPYSFNITTNPSNETYNLTNGTTSSSNPPQEFSRFFPIIVAEMVLSCLCLVISIAVYSVLPEFRNVHGKNLISMSACLLVTFVMLIFDLLVRKIASHAVCFNIAMVIHVTFLANFFWTNVMAFDIWKSLTDMKAKGEVKGSSKKYLKYAVYAWTATLLTALPAAVLELTDWVPSEFRPKFGEKRCWLSGKTAFYIYFNLPVGLILLSNLCMFLLTLRKLVLIKRMTAVLNVKQQQKRLNLYMKLFLVMGITWTAEFMPLVTGVRFLYAVAGMMTALHGVFLFAIFVCRKKILVGFYHALRSEGKSSSVSNSTGQQTLSSSSNNKKFSVDKLSDSKF